MEPGTGMGFMAFARDAELLAALTKESAWNATKANTTPRIDPTSTCRYLTLHLPIRDVTGRTYRRASEGLRPEMLSRAVRRRDQPRIGADGLIVAAEDAGEE